MFRPIAASILIGLFSHQAIAAEAAKSSGSTTSVVFRFQDMTVEPEDLNNPFVICYDANLNGDSIELTVKKDDKSTPDKDEGMIGKLKCARWGAPPNEPNSLNSDSTLVVAISTKHANELEKMRLAISVAAQATPVENSVRPQAQFGPTEAKSEEYFIVWPYKMTGGTTPIVSLSLRGTDEKATIAGSDWPLPAVPSRYSFGIMPGIVVSSVESKSYSYSPSSTTESFTPIEAGSTRIVDPVLFLSWYTKPIDPASESDLPQAWVFGVSFKSPTSSYYLAHSWEVIRNIALVVGVNAAKVSRLSSDVYDSGPSATHTSPPTREEFEFGGFVGITFNFSTFLQQSFFAGK